MTEKNETALTEAKINKLKSWSPVWIIPLVTLLIGAWILYYHFSHQGPEVTLITYNAEGIEAGKTKIKSRSVDIGLVESVTLDSNFSRVIINARLDTGMNELLRSDTAFWVVRPQIGKEGVTGLGTLLSGAYIELQPGLTGKEKEEFDLLDAPPLASPDAKGIRINLVSERAGQLNAGDPVLFRGYQVGSVETSEFNIDSRDMHYQLFIKAPYDKMVTSNVRFWKDSGIAFDMSSSGVRVEMASLSTLFSGGVSFDVPAGWLPGEQIAPKTEFKLYDNEKSIQNSLYTDYRSYIMFFSDSVRGLQAGAPVEFRGIRMGTVVQVPYYTKGMQQSLDKDFRIPVLIHVEPERFANDVGESFDFVKELSTASNNGLRASLKSGNLLTGALYIDLDFYPDEKKWEGPREVAGFQQIPTVGSGLAQIQQKVMTSLDKINNLPVEPMLKEMTATLSESQKAVMEAKETLKALNAMIGSDEFRNLPNDIQQSLKEINRSMQGFQPGSPAYGKMIDNMQQLDQVLREMQPLLKTLNNKSNALIFEAKEGKDPEPKRAEK
ncbi:MULTISPECIES: intermembrane transport protein PqiB [Proteus]|uniref:Paraquat-inducible protein B n=2 Tax=Enterobacterales TaxID=91347 RepID=A0A379F543_PROVU|nr:intermembrane transport protein PqiB [Proteus vulgaris]MBI6510454.1 intermembrane transport protein PqiB [Proteus sp. PR00174]NBN47589.1 intermembrane transport protein PqiB [Proteus sp. G2626]NBN61521.1 intermembrane transport protein PqiB [Proteus sp. G2639]NBN75511.1 intermembrane transport protein PqiB [Proteus sp. G2615]NBN87333.1 intermembrane transport protein PqiB [Proteus sp. G2300]RNT26627.1 intermembrane transport protein PqiB [Proteus mirabilis]